MPFDFENPSQPALVLSLSECVLSIAGAQDETVRLDTRFDAGELVLLHVEDEDDEDAVVQAICGLLPPVSGQVRFHGHDWQALPPDRANALRGRIGVVFRHDNWIPYQSMMDNLMLPQLHHTKRSYAEIRRDAAKWICRFGLPGLPLDVPAAMSAHDRLCANFARAFIGSPSLILIEDQMQRNLRNLKPVLVNAVRTAREHGAAVIWFTRDLALVRDATLPATRRLRVGHGTLATVS